MDSNIDDICSSGISNSIHEAALQVTCEVNNMIEDFIVSNVNEYGNRYHNWVQVNAEKICEAIMNSRENKKTEHDVKLETLKAVKERAHMLFDKHLHDTSLSNWEIEGPSCLAFRDLMRELREAIEELEKSNE